MTAVVAWSTAGGLLLGAIADALLVGVAVCVLALSPAVQARLGNRFGLTVVALVLVLIPVVSATLGYFEGRLKTT